MRISLPIWSTNYTFLAFFVRFIARHKRMGALVSKPVAARGFMSGRGPEAVPRARANGRDEDR